MSAQVQCPNCGGYRVITKQKLIHQGRKLIFKERLEVGKLVGCLWGVIMPILVVVAGFALTEDDFSDSALSTVVLLVALCLLVALVGVGWYLLPIHRRETLVGYGYECELCGKQWNEYLDQGPMDIDSK